MLILGINMFHPDASAAILQDGKVIFAVAEERLNRKKHYAGFPDLAIKDCLRGAGARLRDVDHVAIGRDVRANRPAKARYALKHFRDLPTFLKLAKRWSRFIDFRTMLAKAVDEDPQRVRLREHHVEHHLAHIASSFFTSGWDRAAGLTYDGSGDFVTTTLSAGVGNDIRIFQRIFVPHSIGMLYTMVCDFIGYRHYGDEGKVMGLAAHGTDRLCAELRDAVRELPDGYELNLRYFLPFANQIEVEGDDIKLRRTFADLMSTRFGPAREPTGEITGRDKDLAFAVQRRFEDIAFHLVKILHRLVPTNKLTISGGAALNSVANGKIAMGSPFKETWIHPAPGDDGLAVGAALYTYHATLRQPRTDCLQTASLGSEFSEAEIRQDLEAKNVKYERYEREPLLQIVAKRIAAGNVIGWFQGRMEWGPRALGNRSILAHPGHSNIKDILNSRIKNREWFRPFASSILAEKQHEYFESSHHSPFMLHVYPIKPEKRNELCAVNHVDNTGRVQTVTHHENPLYYDLIKEFERHTGTPVLLNTSFNENEPIVCRPAEAIDCFMRSGLDVLAIGPFVVAKSPSVP